MDIEQNYFLIKLNESKKIFNIYEFIKSISLFHQKIDLSGKIICTESYLIFESYSINFKNLFKFTSAS